METQALDNIVSFIMEALYTCCVCMLWGEAYSSTNWLHVEAQQKHTHSELVVHTLVWL